jgi:calcium-dependent protein kinase
MAPEVIKNSYDNQADIWSIGVILYILTTGIVPFGGQKNSQIVKNILNGNFNTVN